MGEIRSYVDRNRALKTIRNYIKLAIIIALCVILSFKYFDVAIAILIIIIFVILIDLKNNLVEGAFDIIVVDHESFTLKHIRETRRCLWNQIISCKDIVLGEKPRRYYEIKLKPEACDSDKPINLLKTATTEWIIYKYNINMGKKSSDEEVCHLYNYCEIKHSFLKYLTSKIFYFTTIFFFFIVALGETEKLRIITLILYLTVIIGEIAYLIYSVSTYKNESLILDQQGIKVRYNKTDAYLSWNEVNVVVSFMNGYAAKEYEYLKIMLSKRKDFPYTILKVKSSKKLKAKIKEYKNCDIYEKNDEEYF